MPNENKSISQLTIDDIAAYLRLAERTEADNAFLTTALDAARAFVYKYTGLSPLQADASPDLTIAVYVLSQDMYDNRSLIVDGQNVNKVVESILGLHSVNLL